MPTQLLSREIFLKQPDGIPFIDRSVEGSYILAIKSRTIDDHIFAKKAVMVYRKYPWPALKDTSNAEDFTIVPVEAGEVVMRLDSFDHLDESAEEYIITFSGAEAQQAAQLMTEASQHPTSLSYLDASRKFIMDALASAMVPTSPPLEAVVTDRARLVALLSGFGIAHTVRTVTQTDTNCPENGTVVTIEVHDLSDRPENKVRGYYGFHSDYVFDADETFLHVGVWE